MTRFYPKRLLRREQRETERIIARAVLAGFVASKMRYKDDNNRHATVWEVFWPDGSVGHFYGRAYPALMYLCMVEHGASWIEAWSIARRRALRGEL